LRRSAVRWGFKKGYRLSSGEERIGIMERERLGKSQRVMKALYNMG
jgi:hypothetical protein